MANGKVIHQLLQPWGQNVAVAGGGLVARHHHNAVLGLRGSQVGGTPATGTTSSWTSTGLVKGTALDGGDGFGGAGASLHALDSLQNRQLLLFHLQKFPQGLNIGVIGFGFACVIGCPTREFVHVRDCAITVRTTRTVFVRDNYNFR